MITRIKNNKILMILMVLIVGVLLALTFRITHAFLAKNTTDVEKKVVGTSDKVDQLNFIAGDPLTLKATSTTLPESGENIEVVSKPVVTLLANSTNNIAIEKYYAYLTITNNFEYSSEEKTPEIILSITDPNGNEIQMLDDLVYGTTYGVSGFDITNYNGTLNIAEGYEIKSTSSTEPEKQEWTLKITYMNLSGDQSTNYEKTLDSTFVISKTPKE